MMKAQKSDERLLAYETRQARQDKTWAKKALKDKEWLARASDYSKKMAEEYSKKSVSVMSKERAEYLKLRAAGGHDETAALKLKRVTAGKARGRPAKYLSTFIKEKRRFGVR